MRRFLIGVLEGGMTVAERDLLEHGDAGLMRQLRLRSQENDQRAFEAPVERSSGRRVVGYQSQVLSDPEWTIEVLLLGEQIARDERRPPPSKLSVVPGRLLFGGSGRGR